MSYNPFSGWRTTGSWADHASYSQGGIDKPLPYGTALPAAASGTLRTKGGTGEFAAGKIGSAGLRSILELDTPLKRRIAASPGLPPEGSGDCVAIVYQHQSRFGDERHYDERQTLGWSGDSDGTSDGGDTHLHWHGLNAQGQRVNIESFLGSSSTAGGGGSTPIPSSTTPEREEELMTFKYIRAGKNPDNTPRKDASMQPIYQVSEQVPLQKKSISNNDWAVLSAGGARYIDTNQNVVDDIPGS